MDLVQLAGWFTTVIVAVIAGLFQLLPKKGSMEHQLIDQYQEQNEKLIATVEKLESRAETRESYIRKIERQLRAWAEFSTSIRIGVEQGDIPPWPPVPKALEEDL